MVRRGYRLLGVVAAAAIAGAGLTPAFADEVAPPARVADEAIAAPGPAAIATPAPAAPVPASNSNARAELARVATPSKPRTVQPSAPARPIVVAERQRCWFICGHQMVLMLGVAY